MSTPDEQATPDCPAWISGRFPFRRWSRDGIGRGRRHFPEEMPIALVVNDTEYAVMLASPVDVTDFAYGLLRTEALIHDATEIETVEIHQRPEGWIVQVRLFGTVPRARRRRRLAGVSSCGLCGVQSLRDAIRPLARCPDGPVFHGAAIVQAMAGLREVQPYNAIAGAMHAAAFSDSAGRLLCAREDVGRHNALDKLIGALVRAGTSPESGFVVTSSRCSYELVQKTAAFGVPLLCTASAPTALAVRLAQQANISLLSLARNGSFLAVAGDERIDFSETATDE